MFKFAKWIQQKVQPQKDWPLSTNLEFARQRETQALWIGIIAFLLPALLYYSNRTSLCFRDTISHTYYVPFWGDVFVALTSFVGLFLLFYRGQSRSERALAVIAGICAVLAALIPTTGSGCENVMAPSRVFLLDQSDITLKDAFFPADWFELAHGLAAGGLFFVLTIFSLFVFTATDMTNPLQASKDNRNKRIRNWIYKVSGVIMFVTVAVLAVNKIWGFEDCDIFNRDIGIGQLDLNCRSENVTQPSYWDNNNLTFYLEWLALACFGLAWFVKGRGGGFLLRDDTPNQIISKPWWWPIWLE